jgi:hypothetical protein
VDGRYESICFGIIKDIQTTDSSDRNSQTVVQPEQPINLNSNAIIISKNIPSKSASTTIKSLSVNEDTVLIEVGYSGGCDKHEFTLYTDGSIEKTFVPQVTLKLVHVTNDLCETEISSTLKFDLNPLKKYYKENFNDTGPITLQIAPNREYYLKFEYNFD